MRGAISKLTAIALLAGATGFFVLGHPAEVRAQTVFCPPGFTLKQGACTNGKDGAFSGAAVASQALSELSETTTQETTKNTLKSVAERREQEKERCAAGFSRVDGTCQRIPAPVAEAAPAVAPEERAPKKAKKPKLAAMPHKEVVAPAAKIVQGAPPAMVCKDGPCAPPFIPIEPAVRFGTWTQVYGDYEKRSATGFADLGGVTALAGGGLCAGGASCPLTNSVQSRTGTIGFLVGADLTSRDVVFGNDGLIAGVLAGYVSSKLTLNTSSLSNNLTNLNNGFSRVNANLTGPTAGLYATYFNGGFSTDFTLRVDALDLDETFNETLGFNNGGGKLGQVPNAGGASVSLLNATIAGNLNYRFDLYPNFWVEPTVGAQYTNSSYGGGAAQLGLADGNLVMVQGGARVGTTTLINDRVLMTTTLTGLAYDDVLVAGGFIPVSLFNGVNLLAQADQGKVRGRGILALNFDCGQGITSFVQGEARGGSGLFGAGGKAGIRVEW